MEQIHRAVPAGSGVRRRNSLRAIQHIGPIDWNDGECPCGKIRLKLRQGRFARTLRKSRGFVAAMPKNLQAHRLAKLVNNQTCDDYGCLLATLSRNSLWGMHERNIQRANVGRVGKLAHPSSPSRSKSRISLNSLAEKTRLPQIARNCAAKSIFAGAPLCLARGVKRANGLPRRRISTSSP